MDLEQFKDAQRKLWAMGDYRPVGRLIEPAARTLVERAGVDAGDRVLDVATGSGSVAVAAARAGAAVLGVDITDAWFDEARRRAAEADVRIDLALGDAEDLPVADRSFDLVLSSFGAIFAPRHDVVAAELVRVCRPGGTIAVNAWTPGGANDAMVSAMGAYLPAPPPFVTPSIRWGDPDHVRELFAPHAVDVRFERHAVPVAFPSVDAFVSFVFENSGALMSIRDALQADGRWDDASADMRRAVEDSNAVDDGSFRVTWDYLTSIATTRADAGMTGPQR